MFINGDFHKLLSLKSFFFRDLHTDTNKTRVIKTILEEVAPDGRVLSSVVESETKKHYY